MSVAILLSRAQQGTSAPPVTIEVFLSGGLPGFSVVGMPATAVRESKDRVRSALISSGFRFPQERITVSLGPADMPKTGGRFDLAIALGILVAARQVQAASLERTELYGELALNGELRPVPGILPAAMKAADDGRRVFVPAQNASEAALVSDRILPARSLLEVTAHLNGSERIAFAARTDPTCGTQQSAQPDIADVKGQSQAKRALEVAAAGGHNILLVGPPGTGKSMLAARLPGLLPPMSESEALETAAIESVLGMPLDLERWRQRPFRAPHHSATAPALVGGGPGPRPGEISRAHNGVLFLDELPEFKRNVLEELREPLEAGYITIARAGNHARYWARLQLVAAMNPCPCGFFGDESGACICSAERVAKYRQKISGPLLDRIDLQVQVNRPAVSDYYGATKSAENSRTIAARVAGARAVQRRRGVECNARLPASRIDQHCELDDASRKLLDNAVAKFSLSVRSYQRILRISRTIADLDGSTHIAMPQVAEALMLRGVESLV